MTDKPRKSTRYRDIAAELQKEIRLGTYPIGELLPIETELMARFAASRQTVREALRIVTEQGLIVRRAGLGSVVIATEPPVLFTHSVKSLNEWLRYSNETYREVVQSRDVTADRKLAAILKCEPGKHWFLIESIRRADAFAEPLGWTEIYVLRKFAGVIERRDHGRAPVHEQIAKMYGQAPQGQAGLAGIDDGAPILRPARRAVRGDHHHASGRAVYVFDGYAAVAAAEGVRAGAFNKRRCGTPPLPLAG
jgi:DNA-binding GntR family transcriptional regulator